MVTCGDDHRPVRAAALVLVWSSGFIGAELGARAAPPATVLAWRFLVTAVVLLPWLLPASGRLDRRGWMRQAVLALLCQCLYLAGVFWAAAAGVPAGTSALVGSLQPALVLAAAAVLEQPATQTRPHRRVGAGIHRRRADRRRGPARRRRHGGTGAAAVGDAVLDRRHPAAAAVVHIPASSTPLMQTLAVQAVFSAAFFTAYTASAGALTPPATMQFWVATAWAVVAGIGGYGLYYLVTTRDGAARASTVLYLTPAATALWAALMFGQPAASHNRHRLVRERGSRRRLQFREHGAER